MQDQLMYWNDEKNIVHFLFLWAEAQFFENVLRHNIVVINIHVKIIKE